MARTRGCFPLCLLALLPLVLAPAPGCSRRGEPGASRAPSPAASPAERPAEGRVERVFDGDSLVVAAGERREEVRLFGIDAPERTQPFSARSRRFAADLALGREVRLARHGTDAYGRTLAEVLLPDGRSLNRELVRAGLAWWYRRYAPEEEALAELERGARAARIGLWSEPDPVPPWDFRAARRREGAGHPSPEGPPAARGGRPAPGER